MLCVVLLTAAEIKGVFFFDPHHFLETFGYDVAISQYNLFTPLIIFLLRYYYLLYTKKDEYKIGKLHYLPYKPFGIMAKYISIMLLISIPAVFLARSLSNNTVDFSQAVNAMYIFLMLSLLTWIFSRQKREDELIHNIRLESMQLAVYFNYAVLLLANLALYSGWFLLFMFMNLITIEVFFLIRFYCALLKLNKETSNPAV